MMNDCFLDCILLHVIKFLADQVADKLFDEINWLTVHSLKAVSVSIAASVFTGNNT